jgi:hypothetical protein
MDYRPQTTDHLRSDMNRAIAAGAHEAAAAKAKLIIATTFGKAMRGADAERRYELFFRRQIAYALVAKGQYHIAVSVALHCSKAA